MKSNIKTNSEIFDEMLDLVNLVEVSLVNETRSSEDYYTVATRLERAMHCALVLGDRTYREENKRVA